MDLAKHEGITVANYDETEAFALMTYLVGFHRRLQLEDQTVA